MKQAKTIDVSPALREKVLALSRLAQVPSFPGSSGSSSAGVPQTGIEGALLTLTEKIELMHKDMVTLDALQALKSRESRTFKTV